MNVFSILSFVFAGVVFFGTALMSTKTPMIYLDLHAAMIVFGGTLAATAISFRMERMFALVKVFFLRVIRGTKFDYVPLIREMMVLAEAYRTNNGNLKNLVDSSKDPFLKEAMSSLLDGAMDNPTLIRVLQTRANSIFHRYNEEALKFKALGKFPPAFGLMGAVLGMIGVLQELGKADGAANIGPSMAIALVGTLYGIAFANILILPIAENLIDGAKEVRVKNQIIVEGMKHIMAKKNPILLAEELNSFLLASERIDWKTVSGSGGPGSGKAAA